MSLVVITIQDEQDGNVSFGFTGEPVIDEGSDMSDAQILGMIAMQAVMAALQESQEEASSSIEG